MIIEWIIAFWQYVVGQYSPPFQSDNNTTCIRYGNNEVSPYFINSFYPSYIGPVGYCRCLRPSFCPSVSLSIYRSALIYIEVWKALTYNVFTIWYHILIYWSRRSICLSAFTVALVVQAVVTNVKYMYSVFRQSNKSATTKTTATWDWVAVISTTQNLWKTRYRIPKRGNYEGHK